MFPFTLRDLLIHHLCATVVIKVVFRNATEAGFEIYMGPLSIEYYAASKMIKEVLYKMRFLSNYEKNRNGNWKQKDDSNFHYCILYVRKFVKRQKLYLLFTCVVCYLSYSIL